VLIAGAAFNWSWLVAAGAAPLLLTFLPCLAMCALSLCSHRTVEGGCKDQRQEAPARPDALASPAADQKAPVQRG
jgi:hypothetical protein